MWPILGLALPGLVLGVLALGHSERRVRRSMGIFALVVSALSSSFAIAGALTIRSKAQAAIVAATSEVAEKRIRRGVALDTRIPLRWGLGSALIPLLGGLTGALSSRKLRRGKPMSVRSVRAPHVEAERLQLSIGVSVLASGGAIGAAALLLAPLPGPQLPIQSSGWDALEAVELMKSGASAKACEELERAAASGGADPKLVPEARSAASECFELRFEEALSHEPAEAVARLDALVRSPMPFTQGQRVRAEAELRKAKSGLASEPASGH